MLRAGFGKDGCGISCWEGGFGHPLNLNGWWWPLWGLGVARAVEATRRTRPAGTALPLRWFQVRSWAEVTPKRSETEVTVSPRRVV